jgi:hypothetical protein
MPIKLYKFIMCDDYTFAKIPCKDLCLQWNLHFQFFYYYYKLTTLAVLVLYTFSLQRIFTFTCKLQHNSSGLCVNWTFANGRNKEFQDASLGPVKSLLNVTFGGLESNTFARALF